MYLINIMGSWVIILLIFLFVKEIDKILMIIKIMW